MYEREREKKLVLFRCRFLCCLFVCVYVCVRERERKNEIGLKVKLSWEEIREVEMYLGVILGGELGDESEAT